MSYIWLFIKNLFIGIIVFFTLLPIYACLAYEIIKLYLTINAKPKSTQE